MNRLILILLALTLIYNIRAQNTCFQKVYSLSDTSVIFNNVHVKGQNYLLSGSMGKGSQRFFPFILELDENGSLVQLDKYLDFDNLHKTSYSYTELEPNVFGDLMLHYSTINKNASALWLHTVLGWNQQTGFDSIKYLDTLKNNYFKYFDAARLVIDNSDSSYYTVGNYWYDSALDTAQNLPNNSGIYVIKFSQVNDSILWKTRLTYSFSPIEGPLLSQYNLLKMEDGQLMLVSAEFQIVQLMSGTYSKIKFYRLNASDGQTILPIKTLQDTPFSLPGYGATFINNEKDLLLSYSESDTCYTSSGQPYHAVRPTVARLDSNFNLVWKDTLRTYLSSTLGSGGCIEKFAVQGDSSFVGAHVYTDVKNEGLPNHSIYFRLRLTNRKQSSGATNWDRDYSFYPFVGNDYIANYDIHDVENTSDGGYIFVGESTNFDSLNANAPGQLGYVLKTNCLGFLDDPQAGFTAENNDSLGIGFTNTSLMGGSYLWDFGDGSTLETSEFVDSVFHQYSDSGTYEVMLIALGCNGANDTIVSSVYVSKYNTPEPPVNPNIVNYMALGPNPVQSGESIAVYVGNLPSNSCWLAFYDAQGKLVMEHAFQQSKTTNIIVLPLSAGVYQAVLKSGDNVLQVEKVLLY